ncbi:MAG: hypothetical protein J0L93_11075 [Deltaproteobacteria bacterium]|nr:hypothetical protein [Deltaproteobacteria bacterium]
MNNLIHKIKLSLVILFFTFSSVSYSVVNSTMTMGSGGTSMSTNGGGTVVCPPGFVNPYDAVVAADRTAYINAYNALHNLWQQRNLLSNLATANILQVPVVKNLSSLSCDSPTPDLKIAESVISKMNAVQSKSDAAHFHILGGTGCSASIAGATLTAQCSGTNSVSFPIPTDSGVTIDVATDDQMIQFGAPSATTPFHLITTGDVIVTKPIVTSANKFLSSGASQNCNSATVYGNSASGNCGGNKVLAQITANNIYLDASKVNANGIAQPLLTATATYDPEHAVQIQAHLVATGPNVLTPVKSAATLDPVTTPLGMVNVAGTVTAPNALMHITSYAMSTNGSACSAVGLIPTVTPASTSGNLCAKPGECVPNAVTVNGMTVIVMNITEGQGFGDKTTSISSANSAGVPTANTNTSAQAH